MKEKIVWITFVLILLYISFMVGYIIGARRGVEFITNQICIKLDCYNFLDPWWDTDYKHRRIIDSGLGEEESLEDYLRCKEMGCMNK